MGQWKNDRVTKDCYESTFHKSFMVFLEYHHTITIFLMPIFTRVGVTKVNVIHTLGCKMFGPFWSVWCKMALAEVGESLP